MSDMSEDCYPYLWKDDPMVLDANATVAVDLVASMLTNELAPDPDIDIPDTAVPPSRYPGWIYDGWPLYR